MATYISSTILLAAKVYNDWLCKASLMYATHVLIEEPRILEFQSGHKYYFKI